jgi:hypothetical protein
VGANPSPTVGHKGSSIALNSVLCQGSARKLPLLVIPPFLDVLQNVRRNYAKQRIPLMTMTNCLHINKYLSYGSGRSLFGIFNFALHGRAMCWLFTGTKTVDLNAATRCIAPLCASCPASSSRCSSTHQHLRALRRIKPLRAAQRIPAGIK